MFIRWTVHSMRGWGVLLQWASTTRTQIPNLESYPDDNHVAATNVTTQILYNSYYDLFVK